MFRPPLGLSCDDVGLAELLLGDIFHTTLSSAGDTSTPSTVLGVLDIKSDNGILCGIGVAGWFTSTAVSFMSDGAGVVGLYAKCCNLFIVDSDGFAEVDEVVPVAATVDSDLFSHGRLNCP